MKVGAPVGVDVAHELISYTLNPFWYWSGMSGPGHPMQTPTSPGDKTSSSSPKEKNSHPSVSWHNWLHSSNVIGSLPGLVLAVLNNRSSPHLQSSDTRTGLPGSPDGQVGASVGLLVGEEVGTEVGLLVGEAEGLAVGVEVGLADGDPVGLAVGG